MGDLPYEALCDVNAVASSASVHLARRRAHLAAGVQVSGKRGPVGLSGCSATKADRREAPARRLGRWDRTPIPKVIRARGRGCITGRERPRAAGRASY